MINYFIFHCIDFEQMNGLNAYPDGCPNCGTRHYRSLTAERGKPINGKIEDVQQFYTLLLIFMNPDGVTWFQSQTRNQRIQLKGKVFNNLEEHLNVS